MWGLPVLLVHRRFVSAELARCLSAAYIVVNARAVPDSQAGDHLSVCAD